MFTLHVAPLLTSVAPSCARCLVEALILSCPSLVSCPATSYPNPGQVGRRGGTDIHHLRPGKERRAAEDEMVR